MRVQFIGPLPDSVIEGQPISILDGYVTGRTVITTDLSGIFNTFADGIDGLVVEKRSVASLQSVLNAIDPLG